MKLNPMNAAPTIHIFKFNAGVFFTNLEDISHADSITLPPADCNTINWIVGHIVATRDSILKLLNEEGLCEESDRELYGRGTKLTDTAQAVSLDTLKERYQRSQEMILAGLEALSGKNDEKSEGVVVQLAGFGFHEAYHIGQLGVIRKLIGKEPKIQ